jgi:putative ABC transport system permease protein
MIAHLFKLIWNRKKQNFLIMTELLFSFLIMFAVFTLITSYYQSYGEPNGFDPTDVWSVSRTGDETDTNAAVSRDSIVLLDRIVRQQIKAMPEVQEISYSNPNTPYANNHSNVTLIYGKIRIISNIFTVEDSYASLLNMKMKSGRWFQQSDDASNYKPAVINVKLKEKFFGKQDGLNRLLTFNEVNYKIVGVVYNSKNEGDYVAPDYEFYTRADSTFYGTNKPFLIKVRPGTDARFEAQLFKYLSNIIKNSSIEVEHLEKRRIYKNKQLLIPVIILLTVAVFLIINVALGLFGVLWHNINKRRGEIGLRRASGASELDISKQLIGETMVLATLSMIVGAFFAIQFPLMNVFDIAAEIYLVALGLAIIFIYIFVFICALYPALQAAAIYPAVALHEE